MPAQVIIKLIPDTSEMPKAEEAVASLAGVDKETADQIKATNKAFSERNKAVEAGVSSADKLAAASKKLVESIAGGAINQAAKNIDKIADSIDNTNAETAILNKTLDIAKKKLADLDKDSPEFDKLSKEIEAAELSLENMGKAATSSRQQLRQYRETLLQLEEAGLDGTDVFNDMAVAAGELEDQIGDTSARIKALASDTFELDAGVEVAQGVAAGFAVAQGAAALFGDESEDLQKTLLKVNAAMSILQGLQEIQNLLQAQSNASIAISLALKKIEVLQTNLQAAAESRNIVVRYAAIVAQKALNAVMALSPAGILLITIGALAGALLLFSQESETAAEKQEKLNAALEKTNASLDEQIDINERLRNTRQGGLNDQQAQLDLLKAQGAAQSQILAQERKLLEAQLENEKVRKESLRGQKGREKEFEESASNIVDIERQLGANSIDAQEAAQDESLKSAAAYADARVAEAIDGSKKELDAQISAIKARRAQELSDNALTAGERAKIVAESNKQIKDLNNNFQKEQLNNRVNALQAESALTLDLAEKLELDRAAVILKAQSDSIGKTTEQQLIIEKQKQAQLKQIDNDAAVAILSQRLALYQAAAANEKDNAVKDESTKNALIVQAQIDSVGKSAAERLLIEKKLQADITQLSIDAEVRRGQLQLTLLKRRSIGERDEVKKLQNQKEQVIAQAQIDSAGKTKDEILQIEADKNNALLDLDEQIKQVLIQRRLQAMDAIVSSTLSLVSSLNEISRNQADYELSVLKERLDQGLISQEEYERKTKAIKIRVAQQEKQLAIFQAAVNAATAIVKVFATTGPPLSFILAATTAAATLAQIAAISSKPIPAFKKGTKNAPGGPSLIGEAGPELYFAQGKWGYAAGPTILDLPKGSKVIPTLETEKILHKYDIPLPKIPSHMEISTRREKIDYNKIGAAVGKHLEKLPLTVHGYDKDGPWQHTTTMQNRHRFINKKFGRHRR